MNEAPVSFNVKAYSPAGFNVMLTLRGEDTAELMPRALKALEWLLEQGFTPNGVPAANGNRSASGSAAASADGEANGNGNAPQCPTHNKPMRASKHGGWYCPVRIADDDGTGKPAYCRQRVAE